MTFQRKLLLAFSLMAIPALLIGAEAIRTNVLERRALQTLGENMARNRTYADLESAMFDETQTIWRSLSGMDPTARKEFELNTQVVDYWQKQWRAKLRPNEMQLANSIEEIQRQIVSVTNKIFALYDSGKHEDAYRLAQLELRERLLPALTNLNRDIYRRARESSVRGAYTQLEDILRDENRVLLAILILAVGMGLLASLQISRSLARPINQLRGAMNVVGSGNLEHPIDIRAPDEIGDLARAFANMTDKLQRTQAQLVQSERLASIGEMAAAVAHGIRNPLASLRAAAQLALRHAVNGEARERLEVIIYEVDRLDKRVSHLLNFSRPAPFHPLRESVSRLVEDLLPPFTELLRERKIGVHTELAPALPDVRVDPMQIEQALVEIVSNALDAMPDGGRLRIVTRLEHDDEGNEDGAGVVIEILDSGVGIPEHVLSSVFEPFFTTRPEGTGLGLAISKRYVEQNGGTLEIVSQSGAGTTVRVHLPATPAGNA